MVCFYNRGISNKKVEYKNEKINISKFSWIMYLCIDEGCGASQMKNQIRQIYCQF